MNQGKESTRLKMKIIKYALSIAFYSIFEYKMHRNGKPIEEKKIQHRTLYTSKYVYRYVYYKSGSGVGTWGFFPRSRTFIAQHLSGHIIKREKCEYLYATTYAGV